MYLGLGHLKVTIIVRGLYITLDFRCLHILFVKAAIQ